MLLGLGSAPGDNAEQKNSKVGQDGGVRRHPQLHHPLGTEGGTRILRRPFCVYGQRETQAGLTAGPVGERDGADGAPHSTLAVSKPRESIPCTVRVGGKEHYSGAAYVWGTDTTAPGGQLMPGGRGSDSSAGPPRQRWGWASDPRNSSPTVPPLRSCPALPATLPWCKPGHCHPGHPGQLLGTVIR